MYAKMVSITLSEVPVVAILVTLAITAVSVSISLGLSGPPVPAHHRRIGLPKSRSNLRHGPEALQPDQPPRLRSLFIYPIKSCRGIEVPRSRVLPTGLQFDRLYTFAQRRAAPDEPDSPWEFLTQRQKPLLAQVKVDLFLPDHPPTTGGGGVLIVRFPWRDRGLAGLCQLAAAKLARGPRGKPERRFALPLDFPSDGVIKSRGYSYGTVRIWKEATTALNLSSEVPAELSKFLGVTHDLGLFRMDPSRQRHVFRCAPTEAIAGYQPAVDFQDAYPLHLMNLNSIRDLESRIDNDDAIHPLDVRRFRSNIIVSAAPVYDEETWRSISFGDKSGHGTGSLFDVSCRTVRCKMPNVDPDTGVRHKAEPDRSLRKHRSVDQGAPNLGCLGMQLCPMFHDARDPASRESVLEVGMDLTVLQRGPHFYIKQ